MKFVVHRTLPPSLDFCQHILEFGIVYLDAVVQVDGDHLVGQMVDLFLVGAQLGVLLLQCFQLLIQLHPLGGGRRRDSGLQVGNSGAVAALLLVDIVGADAGDGIRLIAMHIDERLEAVFLAAVKEPVDGPLLVGLAVVGIEVIEEIAADHVTGRTFAT